MASIVGRNDLIMVRFITIQAAVCGHPLPSKRSYRQRYLIWSQGSFSVVLLWKFLPKFPSIHQNMTIGFAFYPRKQAAAQCPAYIS